MPTDAAHVIRRLIDKFPEIDRLMLSASQQRKSRAGYSYGGRCIWTSEWDKYSVQTYKANFPDCHKIEGDITLVDAAEIPDHDVLLGGFPCQPFSLAGVSKKNALGRLHGFLDETQGTLFFDVARIIDTKRPKAFMLENVKNLLSHDKGRTFEVIRRTLQGLGYSLHYRIINAIHWVPQHRQRIIIIGFREPVLFTWKDLREPEIPKYRTVIFVHGCFWHLHGCKNTVIPQTRTDWWTNKLEGNRDRDERNRLRLKELGWRVIVVWECETVPANLECLAGEIKGDQ